MAGFPTSVANMGGVEGGGLNSKHGWGVHGGSLKCCQKIPVKEFN